MMIRKYVLTIRALLRSAIVAALILTDAFTHHACAVPQNAPPQPIDVAQLPFGFSEQIIATGLDVAAGMAVAPDGRVFICEQTGALRVVKDDRLLAQPVVKLSVDSYWERGLIGIALDPEFSTNQHIYLLYVAAKPHPHHVVSRFTLNGDHVVRTSEKVLLRGDDQRKLGGSVQAGHQGGGLCFGADGKLYIGIGEQTAGRPSQRLDSLLGKLLRIDKEGTIPPDNPFYRQARGRYRAIYARGLRNPYVFAVHPQSGEIYINDVGGNRWEEINIATAGANYGWPISEGPTTKPGHTSPLHAYSDGGNKSITGGLFYTSGSTNGPTELKLTFPKRYHGKYFFADYSQGWIRTLDPDRPNDVQTFATQMHRPVAIALSADGSIYYLNRNEWVKNEKYVGRTSSLHRIFYTSASNRPAPKVNVTSTATIAARGRPAHLRVTATGESPLNYRWLRNGQTVPQATSDRLRIPSMSSRHDGDTYRCVVSNQHGNTMSPPIRLWMTDLARPIEVENITQGVLYQAYNATGNRLPQFSVDLPQASGTTARISEIEASGRGVVVAALVDVPDDDVYSIQLSTTGIAKLFVARQQIAVGRPALANQSSTELGQVGLRKGLHPVLLLFAGAGASAMPQITIEGGDLPSTSIEPLLRRDGKWQSMDDFLTATEHGLPPVQRAADLSPLAIGRSAQHMPPLLSQTGAFIDMKSLQPTSGLIPYDVNTPLWSDGASKYRYIALTGNKAIDFFRTGSWLFPAGTVFVKHFELGSRDASADQPPRRLETRFLVVDRAGSGWGVTYRWRDDQSDAELIDQAIDETIENTASGKKQSKRWYFPSRNDCISCHTDSSGFVLGVNTHQLAGENDSLATWRDDGLFGRSLPKRSGGSSVKKLYPSEALASLDDTSASLEQRARSYLHANCASCHRPGVVRASFDARIHSPNARKGIINGELLSADLGVPGSRIVVPGDPEKSMLYLRLTRRGDAYAMPPLATHQVDKQAAEVIRKWIESLAP